ncbi:hypothetical protein QOT17_010891 [Balamuthia mandrillaris]
MGECSGYLKTVLLADSTAFTVVAVGFAASALGYTAGTPYDLATVLFKPAFSAGYLQEVLLLLSCLCLFIAAALCTAPPTKAVARSLGVSGLAFMAFGGYYMHKGSELFTDAGLLAYLISGAPIVLSYLCCGFCGGCEKKAAKPQQQKPKRK